MRFAHAVKAAVAPRFAARGRLLASRPHPAPPRLLPSLLQVECRASNALCSAHSAGSGGWPTIKYFDATTGVRGANYKKKTSGMVCDELKVVDNMKAYVTETVAARKAATGKADL